MNEAIGLAGLVSCKAEFVRRLRRAPAASWTPLALDFARGLQSRHLEQTAILILLGDVLAEVAFLAGLNVPSAIRLFAYETLTGTTEDIYGAFLADLRRLCGEEHDALVQERSLARRALMIVEEQFREPLSCASLARALHCDRSHLAKVFRKETGETVQASVARARARHALQLVRSEKIDAVASLCGFASRSTFYRRFRQYTGRLPSDYRAFANADIARADY